MSTTEMYCTICESFTEHTDTEKNKYITTCNGCGYTKKDINQYKAQYRKTLISLLDYEEKI